MLPVLIGITGHPPKIYRVPVPDTAGGPPTVLVYRRVPKPHSGRFALSQKWQYEYDPEGREGEGLRWPWSRSRAKPGAAPGGKRGSTDE